MYIYMCVYIYIYHRSTDTTCDICTQICDNTGEQSPQPQPCYTVRDYGQRGGEVGRHWRSE